MVSRGEGSQRWSVFIAYHTTQKNVGMFPGARVYNVFFGNSSQDTRCDISLMLSAKALTQSTLVLLLCSPTWHSKQS